MSRTVGIFTWANRQGASLRSSIFNAVKDYARNRAWNEPEIMVAEDGKRLLEEGGQLGSILKTISAGDRVILRSFADLSDTPSKLTAGISALLGTGADVHMLETGGPLATAWPYMKIAFDVGAAVEASLLAEREQAKQRDEEWAETFTDFQRNASRAMATRLGAELFPELALPAAVIETMPQPASNGHDTSVDHAAIGAFLKARIAQKGISQTVLAARMGVDPSQVSRMLSTGKGPLVLRAFETLAPEALPDADLQASIGAAPDWFLAAYSRANLPKETVKHVN